MLYKNLEKERAKERATWLPYYGRVRENKKAYSRKQKHKVQYALLVFD